MDWDLMNPRSRRVLHALINRDKNTESREQLKALIRVWPSLLFSPISARFKIGGVQHLFRRAAVSTLRIYEFRKHGHVTRITVGHF